MPVDSKLLATIIAVARKESSVQAKHVASLEKRVEAKLKEFNNKTPITDTPVFFVRDECLFCRWPSGVLLDFGSIIGPKGSDGADGKDGIDGQDGKDGKDGRDGKDGVVAAAGRDGTDGKDGRMGPQGPRGAPGPVGLQGEPGKDGKDAERGLQGLPGVDGLDGEDGVGIEKAWVDDNYHLTIRLTSGKVIDAGYVRGPAGVSSGKGGRITGGYIGGGSGSNFYVTDAYYNEVGELIIVNSNDSRINAGIPVVPAMSITWDYLVQNWSVEPTLNATVASGDVYNYTQGGVTRYRIVPVPYNSTEDHFYSDFNGTTLSGFIVARGS